MKQKHTSVPFSYQATLEIEERLSAEDGHLVKHRAEFRGAVHPEPFDMNTAVVLAQQFLQPMVDMGWRVVVLKVAGYLEGLGG